MGGLLFLLGRTWFDRLLGALVIQAAVVTHSSHPFLAVLSGLASDSGSGAAGLEMLIERLGTFRTNDEFLAEIAKG